jgi:hypothetical protein
MVSSQIYFKEYSNFDIGGGLEEFNVLTFKYLTQSLEEELVSHLFLFFNVRSSFYYNLISRVM